MPAPASQSADIQGRAYARVPDIKPGATITVDGDFTCIAPWSCRIVQADACGLFIGCEEGRHYLDGQIVGDVYLGIYPGATS